jgi:hypothetical protein
MAIFLQQFIQFWEVNFPPYIHDTQGLLWKKKEERKRERAMEIQKGMYFWLGEDRNKSKFSTSTGFSSSWKIFQIGFSFGFLMHNTSFWQQKKRGGK